MSKTKINFFNKCKLYSIYSKKIVSFFFILNFGTFLFITIYYKYRKSIKGAKDAKAKANNGKLGFFSCFYQNKARIVHTRVSATKLRIET